MVAVVAYTRAQRRTAREGHTMATIDDTRLNATENDDAYRDGRNCNRDCIVMESEGVVNADSARYVENDDVMNSMAEGYFG